MTNDEQNIAIAQACGWESPNPKHFKASVPVNPLWKHSPEWDGVRGSASSTPKRIPNYTEDLNAMREAEKGMTNNDYGNYVLELRRIVDRDFKAGIPRYPESRKHTYIDCHAESASAAQRAEAFLRTLDLWQDSPATRPAST